MGFFDPFGGNTGGSGNGGGGSNVSIDTTLTQSGKAADAKVTGDKIKKIETDGVATVNGVKVVGELDSVDDLNIAGKVFEGEDSTGEIFNDYENNIANGDYAHAEGFTTMAVGQSSHAEGQGGANVANYTSSTSNSTILSDYSTYPFTLAKGRASHCEGNCTLALGDYSHAEGYRTKAIGDYSHTEGYYTEASGSRSHAEGSSTEATGDNSHAEGGATTASGNTSHAEGNRTTASGTMSHAEGNNTMASSDCQHVQGKYNIEDTNDKYAFIIGNGSSSGRSNAIAIDWGGKIYVNNAETGVDLNTVVQDIANRYTKTETDSAIAAKISEIIANAPEDLDTLKEISTWIEEHADDASAMNLEIQTLKTDKANKTDVYTKTEVDNIVTTKIAEANIISDSVTGEKYKFKISNGVLELEKVE